MEVPSSWLLCCFDPTPMGFDTALAFENKCPQLLFDALTRLGKYSLPTPPPQVFLPIHDKSWFILVVLVRDAFSYIVSNNEQTEFSIFSQTESLEQAAVSICSAAHEVQSQHCCDSLASPSWLQDGSSYSRHDAQSGQEERGRPEPAAAVPLYQKSKSFPTPTVPAKFHADLTGQTGSYGHPYLQRKLGK